MKYIRQTGWQKTEEIRGRFNTERTNGTSQATLWANIIESVNDIWPSIQVIYEQTDLIKDAGEAIQKIKEELGKKLEEANEIIKFLNSKNK